jgi:rubrerythrin
MTDKQIEIYTKTKEHFRLAGIENPAEVIVALVEDIEALEAKQTPRAEWEFENGTFRCSACHQTAPVKKVCTGMGTSVLRAYRTDFCPHCGAKMLEVGK